MTKTQTKFLLSLPENVGDVLWYNDFSVIPQNKKGAIQLWNQGIILSITWDTANDGIGTACLSDKGKLIWKSLKGIT